MNKFFDRAEYRGLEIPRPRKYILTDSDFLKKFLFSEMNLFNDEGL